MNNPDTCSICLEELNEDIKILSCNHKIHNKCFLSLIIQKENTIFIHCPLCREINTDNKRPYNDTRENLNIFTNNNTRCNCKTLKGTRCKNKESFMNNGCCNLHNKHILQKNKFNLIEDFIFYLLETKNTIRTKIYMIDIGKKLILKYPDTINKIQDILYYFFRYYHINDFKQVVKYSDMYEYYNLKLPSENWVENCINKNILF